MRQTVPHVKFELFFGCVDTFSQDNKGMGRLSPFLMWHTDDSDFLHRWVAQETAFHLDRRDVLSATDNYIFKTVANFRETIRVNDCSVACVEPTVPDGRVGCL